MDTSLELKKKILSLFERKYTHKQIANILELKRPTITKILIRYKRDYLIDIKRNGRCGAKRKGKSRDIRSIIRQSKINPEMTARNLRNNSGPSTKYLSLRTIQRYLKENGQLAYRPHQSPKLSKKQMLVRLNWCKKYKDFNWNRVIFSDESTIELNKSRPHFIRRSRSEKLQHKHCVNHKAFAKKVMIWGSVCSKGIGQLAFIDGMMTSNYYLSILANHVVPFKDYIEFFQHDNAPSHSAKTVQTYLKENNIKVLDWPPYSPDLNVIENIWALLKAKIGRKNYLNIAELKSEIFNIWYNDEDFPRYCKSLFESMPKRLNECIAARGGPTKY